MVYVHGVDGRRIKMSKFVMKQRPKKPTEPRTVRYEVGNYVTLGYMQECIEKFKTENPDRSEREIMLNVEETYWHGGFSIYLEAPPQSQRDYEAKLEAYKIELKQYKGWQQAHTEQITKYRENKKKRAAKTKLQRTKERLEKEMAAVEAKLENSCGKRKLCEAEFQPVIILCRILEVCKVVINVLDVFGRIKNRDIFLFSALLPKFHKILCKLHVAICVCVACFKNFRPGRVAPGKGCGNQDKCKQ